MKIAIAFIILWLNVSSRAQTNNRPKFSAEEIKKDLRYLYSNLEAAHFDLYVKTPKKVFEKEFVRLLNGIKDSLNYLQVSRIFQPFVALSGLGHCTTSFPFNESYVPFVMNGGKVFPFDITVMHGRSQITENYAADKTIEKGDELVAIDGTDIRKKLNAVYSYLSGENENFKNTQIDLLHFPRIYWMVFGARDFYKIKIRKANGRQQELKINAITAMEYETKAALQPPVFDNNRSFRFIDKAAYLHPGQFLNKQSNDIATHQAFEKGEFVQFIDSCFAALRNQTKTLIIDLRGNPGGDNSFSDEMVAYFADKPFRFCSHFLVKTSALTKGFWREVQDTALSELKNQILNHKNGDVFEATIKEHLPKADSLRFKGNVFVLVNRYSYSNAVTTAAMIQDYGFGKIIGEETADFPTTYAAVHQFQLPITGIAITYPKAFIIRPNGDPSPKGLIPDYIVSSEDDMLSYALKLQDKK